MYCKYIIQRTYQPNLLKPSSSAPVLAPKLDNNLYKNLML